MSGKYIESYVTSQRPQQYNSEKSRVFDLIPEQQKQNADVLIKLLEDYYAHLNQNGMPSYELGKILNEQDIDSASQIYLEKIQKEIAATFPQSLSFNKVSFYKRIVDYYSSRGTEDSALVFFKLFFDETIEIFYPKDFLFRLSEGRWSTNQDLLDDHAVGYMSNDYEISGNDIGRTLDFINRPALKGNGNDTSNSDNNPNVTPKFYVHGADGDSVYVGESDWQDLSGNGYHVKLLQDSADNANTTNLRDQYSVADRGYNFNAASDDRHYGQIKNLSYSNENQLPELSIFAWVKNKNGSSGTEGLFGNSNWAIIDFDRSEVFQMFINNDGYLSFSARGDASADHVLGSNTVNGYPPLLDLSANGKTIGASVSTRVSNGPYAQGTTQFTVEDATGITVGMNIYATGIIASTTTVSAVNTSTNTIDITGGTVSSSTLTNGRLIHFTEITGSFHGDGEYRLDDEDYHYVGVTYSVAQQRILFWVDGKCAGVFTPRSGKTLKPLGTGGVRRYGIIGDGSESGSSVNENYGDSGRNKLYMKGVIGSIQLFETEICDNDGSISVGDTNVNVSSNMTASNPLTYPKKVKGTLTRYAIDQEASVSSLSSDVTLANTLKAYYDFGITQTFPDQASSIVYDISPNAKSNGNVIGNHINIQNNYIEFKPENETSGIAQQRALTDSIGNIKIHQVLDYNNEHTILCWAKINNGYDGAGFNVLGHERSLHQAFGCLVMYDDQNHTSSLELFVNYVDGSIGRFCPPAGFNITGVNSDASVLAQYWQGTSNSLNKITDNNWHLLAIKGTHEGNDGSIAVSVDGAAFETIFTGNSTTDEFSNTRSTNDFLDFTPTYGADSELNFSGDPFAYIDTQMEKKDSSAINFNNKFPSAPEHENITYVVKFRADTIEDNNSSNTTMLLDWEGGTRTGAPSVSSGAFNYRIMLAHSSGSTRLGLALGEHGLIMHHGDQELLTILEKAEVRANTDYTVVVAMNRTTGNFKSWVNGQLTAEKTVNWPASAYRSSGTTGFKIGANGAGGNRFDGKMSMVAVDTSLWNDTKASNIFANPFSVADFTDPIFVYHFNDDTATLGTPTSEMTSTQSDNAFKTTPTVLEGGTLNYAGTAGEKWELTIGNTQGAGGVTPLFYGVQHTPAGTPGPTNPYGGVYNAPTTFPFSGQINSVFLYNKQLTNAEIASIFNGTKFNVLNNIVISQSGFENTSRKYRIYYEGGEALSEIVKVTGSSVADYNGTYIFDTEEQIWYNRTNVSASFGNKGYFYYNSSLNRWQFGDTNLNAKDSLSDPVPGAYLNPSTTLQQGFWTINTNVNWTGDSTISAKVREMSFNAVTGAEDNVSEIEFENLSGDIKLLSPTFTRGNYNVGKYTNKTGFLSHTNKLLDSNYWQDFSYEIRSGVSSEKWLNEFLTLVHPAGLKLFAAFLLRIFQSNTWDYDLIDEYYSTKKLFESLTISDPTYESVKDSLNSLEDKINLLYKFPNNVNYAQYNQWIRSAPKGSYGIPTFQPGYLYREFAVIQFLVEGFLTPTERVLNSDGTDAQPEVNYWINFGKNYISHIVFETLVLNATNINDRMFDRFVNGELKFGEQEKMTSYLNSSLNEGALDITLDSTKNLKFGAMSAHVRGKGALNILPYERGTLGGFSYNNSDADYIESSTDTDNDSPAAVTAPYIDSKTEIEIEFIPELL